MTSTIPGLLPSWIKKIAVFLGFLLLFWMVYTAADQGVLWELFTKYIFLLVVFWLVVFLVVGIRTKPIITLFTVVIYLLLFWFVVIDVIDMGWVAWITLLAIALFFIGITFGISDFLRQRTNISKRLRPKSYVRLERGISLLGFVAIWICSSVVIAEFFTPQLPTDSERFAHVRGNSSLVPEFALSARDKSIGVALSGGGYRTALFHAETLKALERLGITPSVISSVSGGSIIGAYYHAGGSPDDFRQAMVEQRFNFKRELFLAHYALRMMFPM